MVQLYTNPRDLSPSSISVSSSFLHFSVLYKNITLLGPNLSICSRIAVLRYIQPEQKDISTPDLPYC